MVTETFATGAGKGDTAKLPSTPPRFVAAAALVYGRRNHTINLFTRPSASTAEVKQTRNGYNLDSWFSNGMTFWVVSDLNESELSQFETLYRQN
jgi:anti-sigma factor RsiW